MTMTNTNRPLFKPDTESILVRGLNAMTKACDALTAQNEQLVEDIEELNKKIEMLQKRVLLETTEKE